MGIKVSDRIKVDTVLTLKQEVILDYLGESNILTGFLKYGP